MKSSVIKLLATGLLVLSPVLNAESFENVVISGQETIQGSSSSINAISGWMDFDVHNDVLTITPCDGAASTHGAWVELQYCGLALKENGTVPVTYINKGMFVHPVTEKCTPCDYDACCTQVCPVIHIKGCNAPLISDYDANTQLWTRNAIGAFAGNLALELGRRSYLDTICCQDQLGRATIGLASFWNPALGNTEFGSVRQVVDENCQPVKTLCSGTDAARRPGFVRWYDIQGATACICPQSAATGCPTPAVVDLKHELLYRTYKADGHLFFRVYGCNVKAVSKNPIAASCFYLLGESVQILILGVSGNDSARRDKIAEALCGFGSAFLNIFINLPSTTQEQIIAKVDSEACKGRKASLETALSVLMNQKGSSRDRKSVV